jgi:hypothetical protein
MMLVTFQVKGFEGQRFGGQQTHRQAEEVGQRRVQMAEDFGIHRAQRDQT